MGFKEEMMQLAAARREESFREEALRQEQAIANRTANMISVFSSTFGFEPDKAIDCDAWHDGLHFRRTPQGNYWMFGVVTCEDCGAVHQIHYKEDLGAYLIDLSEGKVRQHVCEAQVLRDEDGEPILTPEERAKNEALNAHRAFIRQLFAQVGGPDSGLDVRTFVAAMVAGPLATTMLEVSGSETVADWAVDIADEIIREAMKPVLQPTTAGRTT